MTTYNLDRHHYIHHRSVFIFLRNFIKSSRLVRISASLLKASYSSGTNSTIRLILNGVINFEPAYYCCLFLRGQHYESTYVVYILNWIILLIITWLYSSSCYFSSVRTLRVNMLNIMVIIYGQGPDYDTNYNLINLRVRLT